MIDVDRQVPPAARAVLVAMSADPLRHRSGRDVADDSGLPFGVVLPILARLETIGLLTSRWDEEAADGPLRRRRYRLSPGGLDVADAVRAATFDGDQGLAVRMRTVLEES